MNLVRLKEVADVRYGLGQPPPSSPVGVPILRATNIQRGRITPDDMVFAALGDLPLGRAPLLQAGEVLVVRSGAYTGDSALITPEWEGSAPGYDLRLTPSGIDSRFLAYQMLSSRVLDQIEIAKTRAAQPHLNAEDLGDVEVAVSTRDQEVAIADYLDAVTARIDALTSNYVDLIDRLVAQRSAITIAGVSGEPLAGPSRSSSLTWLTKVPSHWAEVRLSLLASLGSGHTPSREHPEWWTDCTIPWITTGEVWQIRDDRIENLTETREMISHLGIANSSAELHPAGTVVLSRTASAGYSAIMATDMATSQDYVTWTCGPRLRPRFLLLCLRAMRPDLLGRLAMGSTHQTIYIPDIQSIRIPLPPLDEQDQLVEWTWQRLHRIDAATDAIRRQVELLAERRQALITAVVTGQLEIPGVAA